jgi:hypothetical protein
LLARHCWIQSWAWQLKLFYVFCSSPSYFEQAEHTQHTEPPRIILQTSTNKHTENQCQSMPKWHAHVVTTISNCKCQGVASPGCSTRRSYSCQTWSWSNHSSGHHICIANLT